MKQIGFINPNSTETMTQSCANSLRSEIGNSIVVRALTNHDGPAAIQGEQDGKAALPGLLKTLESNSDCDGFILGCFDDTGLLDARAVTDKPVLGIGQAAFHLATLRHGRFWVLTTLSVSIPVIEENIERQGFSQNCTAVLASGVPVLELEHNRDKSIDTLSKCISSIEEDNPDTVIILGCAGMTNIHSKLQAKHSISLIDPVISAACLIRAMI